MLDKILVRVPCQYEKYWSEGFHTVTLTAQCPLSLTQVTVSGWVSVYYETDNECMIDSLIAPTSGFSMSLIHYTCKTR